MAESIQNFGPEPKLPTPLLKQTEPAQHTYFYMRPTGKIFACYEQEAANVHEYYSVHGRFLGSSDGKTYFRLINEAIVRQNQSIAALDRTLRESKTKLRMLSMRPRLTKKQEKEMEHYIDVQENYDELRREIYDQTVLDREAAENAELAAAKGNMVGPRNMDFMYMTPNGGTQVDPNRIDNLINPR